MLREEIAILTRSAGGVCLVRVTRVHGLECTENPAGVRIVIEKWGGLLSGNANSWQVRGQAISL